jgi:hypothetical protein
VGAVIVLAWPRYLASPGPPAVSDETEKAAAVSEPDGVRSGLVSSEDLIPAGDAVAEQGEVFVFSPGGQKSTPVSQRISSSGTAATAASAIPPASVDTTEGDALNAHLLSDQAGLTSNKKTGPSAGELPCKPDAKAVLKITETESSASPPVQSPAKTATLENYNLGPRGGCYLVTPSGGKKYVDRSLCTRSNAAAARQ